VANEPHELISLSALATCAAGYDKPPCFRTKEQFPKVCEVDPVCTTTVAVNAWEVVDPVMLSSADIQKNPTRPPRPGPTVTLFALGPTAHVSGPEDVVPAESTTTE
jgi:hypothetical protein